MNKQWTVLEALNWTQERFARQGQSNPRLEAQLLTSYATGLSRIDLYAQFDKPLSQQERTTLREAIQQRLEGIPLQYIVGKTTFRYLELAVKPPVLIPRPETELLVELVLQYARTIEAPCILDIGTGTGAIALSLAHELTSCSVIATDKDRAALELAEENVQLLKLDAAQRVRIVYDDFAHELVNQQRYNAGMDVVVSNPPYIPTKEYEVLPDEILHHESRLALDGGEDGLDALRIIAKQAQSLLKPGGLFAVELHEDTLDKASALVKDLAYKDVSIHKDLTGRPRFITAIKGVE